MREKNEKKKIRILSISAFARMKGTHNENIRNLLKRQNVPTKRNPNPVPVLTECVDDVTGRRIGIEMDEKAEKYLKGDKNG
ncbi:MAG: hypothetical protein HGA87_00415 [Desulfobulbaceae bacterium]|nr:hypothetical protein [Desulfobulbaceae bacterium]